MGAKSSFEKCITHGPWGGSQGKNWIYMPKGFIQKINIVHGRVIDAITFQSDCGMGKTESSFFGGVGGDQLDTICIDYPNEYLTSISGTFGSYKGSVVVKSLCFGTNQRNYGPYGSATGAHFSYDGKDGVIVGFHGQVDEYLDAIGIYVMPESLVFGQNSTCENDPTKEQLCSSMSKMAMPKLCSSMSKMAMPREAGPWGASGGKPWDDGVFSDVIKVIVHGGVSLNAICAIQFEYVKRDGKSILSQMHGGGSGDDEMQLLSVVNLDGVDEYLTGISGFYGPVKGYNGLEAITSITFHTNKTIHGPYGKESGAGYTYFTSTASPGKVVGFQGRNNGFLSAIGVHMEYF